MTTSTAYDDIYYPSVPWPAAHPDQLAVMGILHGLAPAPAERCRVLELGCGRGDHLIALAQALPYSRFLGIDLAERVIVGGQAIVRACGLDNVELRQGDLCTLTDLGRFDYVIAHGLYSWVPDAVRDHVLRMIAACLAEQGIAFVSYTVFPGADTRHMVRDALRYKAEGKTGRQQLDQATDRLFFLADTPVPPKWYRRCFQLEASLLRQTNPGNYYHDLLGPCFFSTYVHDFVAHAGRHRLQYLADWNVIHPIQRLYPPEVIERLHRLAGEDRLAREQYRDFLEGRMFRQTLLCRADAAPAPAARPEAILDLNVMLTTQPDPPRPDAPAPTAVQAPEGQHEGVKVQIDEPLVKAALAILGERWPASLPVRELTAQARQRLDAASAVAEEASGRLERELAEFLLFAAHISYVRLHAHVPPVQLTVSERPVASPLARWQAREELPLTNLWHQAVPLRDALLRHLIWLLDGSRDRAALADGLAEFLVAKRLTLQEGGRPVDDPVRIRAIMANALEINLNRIARHCLLIG